MRVNRNYVLTEYVLNENDCIGITHLRASTNKKDQDNVHFTGIDSKGQERIKATFISPDSTATTRQSTIFDSLLFPFLLFFSVSVFFLIVSCISFCIGCHRSCVTSARLEARNCRRQDHQDQFGSAIQGFSESKQRTIRRAIDHPIGSWLPVLPCPKNDSVLSPREFRDGLAIRYQKPLLQMPGTCDGCGALFLEHGLNCANGGNLIRRHNEV